ncbi:MAG: lysophospholipid acyltransferase family protein [Melioribacteraceae bacterium]|nr:lysophospholipid acyltransferase family protein [Melioribacteraceae bacterium]
MLKNSHLTGVALINELFHTLNFSYLILDKDRQKIPFEGKLLIVANHPIGSLDSLALLKVVYDVRQDVKIIANDILYNIENLRSLFLPYNIESISAQKKNILAINEALGQEQAVLMFPAAEVSRLRFLKIHDSKWNKGVIYFSKKLNVPILPIYIKAKNSFLFYFVSILNKNISRLLLAHELFNKKDKSIWMKIGNPIPANAFTNSFIDDAVQTKLLKKHVYLLAKDKKGIYATEKNIIHPVDRKSLKNELMRSQILGVTKDDFKIILTTLEESPNALTEIARLREITFRKVGEGTGNRYDLDYFDNHYKHLIVWDEKELEIVGSYRIGVGRDILEKMGNAGFYTSTLFNYSQEFSEQYLTHSIELGRSFVQKKYWNSNALNYLWQGIGAYIENYEQVKYLFGGVSISNNYPEQTKRMIIYYFSKWFGDELNRASSKRPFIFSGRLKQKWTRYFSALLLKKTTRFLKTC